LLAGSSWQLDPYADPRGVRLCGQILAGLSGLSEVELRPRLDMLGSVARMFGTTDNDR
jgi:hypothetical protein